MRKTANLSTAPVPTTLQALGLRWRFGLILVANLFLQRALWLASRHFQPGTPLAGSWQDILKAAIGLLVGLMLPLVLFYLCFRNSNELATKSPAVRTFLAMTATFGALIVSTFAYAILFGTGR